MPTVATGDGRYIMLGGELAGDPPILSRPPRP